MVIGNSQLNRYFTSAALAPETSSGHTSTSRACRFRSSKRAIAPPTLPDPVPLDQMMLLSTGRSEEHTSELQSQSNLVCRLLLEKKKTRHRTAATQSRRTAPYARPYGAR